MLSRLKICPDFGQSLEVQVAKETQCPPPGGPSQYSNLAEWTFLDEDCVIIYITMQGTAQGPRLDPALVPRT